MARNRMVIATSRSAAAFFQIEVVAQGAAFQLYSPAAQNKIRKAGVKEAADLFLQSFLPLRFTDYIRRPPFNYRYGYTDKHRDPLTTSGALKRSVLGNNTVALRGGKRGAVAKVRLPLTGPASQRRSIIKVLDTVTPREANQMAQACVAAMARMIDSGTTTSTGRRRLARV